MFPRPDCPQGVQLEPSLILLAFQESQAQNLKPAIQAWEYLRSQVPKARNPRIASKSKLSD